MVSFRSVEKTRRARAREPRRWTDETDRRRTDKAACRKHRRRSAVAIRERVVGRCKIRTCASESERKVVYAWNPLSSNVQEPTKLTPSLRLQGNELKLQEMLSGGKEVLVQTRDTDMRTALHYVCGLGSLPCAQALLNAGADPDAADKDGYTPLHISAGYLNADVVQCLLEYGADAEAEDKKGLSVLELVENLRERLPKDDPMVYRRMVVLDNVAKLLEDSVYEELTPTSILDKRERQGKVEYLVHWGDSQEDSWVREKLIGEDIVAAYESGLEYAEAESLLDKRIEEDGTVSFLVRWADECESSWVPKELVDPALLQSWYEEHGDEDEQVWAAEQKAKQEDEEREELAKSAPSGLGLGFGDAPIKF